MPQFILNTPQRSSKPKAKVHPFYELNEFAKGYVEAMFFTNGDTGDEREDMLNDWGVECLTAESVETISRECALFEQQNEKLLTVAYALEPGSADYRYASDSLTADRAGNLFWYARQGHGVAWDDDGNAPCLKALQEASRRFGESYVEAYRRKIHVR